MERNAIVAGKRIRTGLERNIPSLVDSQYRPGDEVLIYRESSSQCIGPQTVSTVEGHPITLRSKNSGKTKDSSQQARPAIWYPIDPSEFFSQMLSPFKSNTMKKTFIENVHMTKVAHTSNPRSENFEEAKRKEI